MTIEIILGILRYCTGEVVPVDENNDAVVTDLATRLVETEKLDEETVNEVFGTIRKLDMEFYMYMWLGVILGQLGDG